MNVCGIICEYNPFHRGHALLLEAARRRLGADTAMVCAMSGDFVQRGAAAAYAKHDRAAAAAACGADLVLELPLPWCLAGAETFARGAVALLAAAGAAHLAFGSESGTLAPLEEAAALLLRPELDGLLREGLARGLSYAAARQQAAETLCGHALPQLTRPNDILAVEYLKALHRSGAAMQALTVERVGAGHDSAGAGDYPSAAWLRQQLTAGEDVSPWLPSEAWNVLKSAPRPEEQRLELALLSRLRSLPEAAFAAAPDAGVGEGFYRRVYEAARLGASLEAIEDAASTRRYPRARVRRLCISAALGLRAQDAAGTPPYLRVLAATERGRALLRQTERTRPLPTITRPAAVRELSPRARRVFDLGAAAADLLALGYADPALRVGDQDWRRSPVIVN